MTQDDELEAMREAARRVVHDVNNALAPVVGFSELLLDDEELLQDAEKVKRYVGLMRDGANEALRLVASLRDFYATPRQ